MQDDVDNVSDFEMAVIQVAEFSKRCLTQEALSDVFIVAVSPNGALQFIGSGRVHPTNEDITISDGAILVYRQDILAAIKASEDGARDDSKPEKSGE